MRIISGKYRGKQLVSPSSTATRPTSDRARETIFNVLEHNPAFSPFSWPKKRVLDVFAGTGALGLEALSRGAESCTFVENNREALLALKQNCEGMGVSDQVDVLCVDARVLPQAPESFQIVFLDPPYGQGLLEPAIQQLVAKNWIETGSILVMEMEKGDNFVVPESFQLILEKKVGGTKVDFYVG